MSPHKLIRYILFGVCALVALAAEPTLSAPRPKETAASEVSGAVKVCVLAILATDQNDTIDPRVACIAREVQKLDPKLTGFQLHKMMSQSIVGGGKLDFNLIADQIVGVSIDHSADQDNRVQMKIQPPLLGEITYETCCGKFLPIVTRYRTTDNQLLILAVRVQPCNKKK